MKYTAEDFKNWSREEIANPRLPYHRCYRPLVHIANSDSFERCFLLDDEYAERPYLLISRPLPIRLSNNNHV